MLVKSTVSRSPYVYCLLADMSVCMYVLQDGEGDALSHRDDALKYSVIHAE